METDSNARVCIMFQYLKVAAGADIGTALFLSITSLVAAAPVLAAAETLQTVKPATTFSTPSVPPAAVDSAVNQIISAVKVGGPAYLICLMLCLQETGSISKSPLTWHKVLYSPILSLFILLEEVVPDYCREHAHQYDRDD